MNYLSHRFSNLTSLVFLLVLSLGTLWVFNFASRVSDTADAWYSYSENVSMQESISQHHATPKTKSPVSY